MTSEQQGSVSDIEALTERFQKLRDRKIESASNLKNAQQSLDKLKQQALEEYGINQLDELKAKLQQIKDENARKRAEYHQSLDEIEAELSKIEAAHNATDVS
ncbi:hypothetical protein [uncultured Gimesia sp.]|jgi:chromosome segregation ATPase|uniref:hypothetical protein n=1 Tax=uncultured Gimesia sp. TaxID=1678688 RepID=UPI0026131D78|nr:hypothetical protein [uncultured Gimesia sp.]